MGSEEHPLRVRLPVCCVDILQHAQPTNLLLLATETYLLLIGQDVIFIQEGICMIIVRLCLRIVLLFPILYILLQV